MKAKSRLIKPPRWPVHRIGKREVNRRLTSLGLSRHDDEVIRNQALAIVERFRQWTDRQACLVTGRHTGDRHEHAGQWYRVAVQWIHLDRRGSWNPDFGNTLPLIDLLHKVQERDGTFFATRGIDAPLAARQHAVKFFCEHPDDACWIIDHANDATVVTLATEGCQRG